MTAVRIASVAALLALGVVLVPAVPAAADFGPIQLVSKSATEQAEEAVAPALSADGRYLAFQGTIGGLEGVFRKDLQTGAVLPVAVGGAYEEEGLAADASAPSISAGRRSLRQLHHRGLAGSRRRHPAAIQRRLRRRYGLLAAGLRTGLGARRLPPKPHLRRQRRLGGLRPRRAERRRPQGRLRHHRQIEPGWDGGRHPPAGQVVLRDLDTRETTLVSVQRNPGPGRWNRACPFPGGR